MTPRQVLIGEAALILRMDGQKHGWTSHDCLEKAVHDIRNADADSQSGAVLRYYRGLSQQALDRLINAVRRKAGDGPQRRVVKLGTHGSQLMLFEESPKVGAAMWIKPCSEPGAKSLWVTVDGINDSAVFCSLR